MQGLHGPLEVGVEGGDILMGGENLCDPYSQFGADAHAACASSSRVRRLFIGRDGVRDLHSQLAGVFGAGS